MALTIEWFQMFLWDIFGGGYDSSIVTGVIRSSSNSKINTFTIGFDSKEHNEAHFAKEIAEYLGTNHKELYCTQEEA